MNGCQAIKLVRCAEAEIQCESFNNDITCQDQWRSDSCFFDRGNSAGGTTSISWRQILSYSHQGLAPMTSSLWCATFFTAARWNSVRLLIRWETHQAPLWGDCNQCAPGGWGRTAEIWVAVFLPSSSPEKNKPPFSTRTLLERDVQIVHCAIQMISSLYNWISTSMQLFA